MARAIGLRGPKTSVPWAPPVGNQHQLNPTSFAP